MTDTTPERHPQRKMGLTMILLAWIVLFGLLAAAFDEWLTRRENPNRQVSSSAHDGVIEVALAPNPQHHYLVDGLLNGQPVTYMVDTGATDVVIPADLADRMGLQRGQRSIANTANGMVGVYHTTLDSLEVGAIRLQRVRASINPGMRDEVVLLGMSALRQVEFFQREEFLVLRQSRN